VEFYYDLMSPNSHPAHGRIRRMCAEHGVELALRTMLIGGVHKAVGLQAPIEVEQKARYQRRDVERWAEYYGVPLRYPDPFRTLKMMRAAMFFGERGGRSGLLHSRRVRAVLRGGRGAEGA
jgi:2-hydroxychromene-2-carboxylate isomerase